MKVRLTDKWIYIIAVINSLLLISIWGVFIEFDTASYIYAWDNSFSHGVIDVFRTPVYPVFIGLMKLLFGKHFLYAIIIVQHIVFVISVYYFHKLLCYLIKSSTTIQIITLIYIIIPATSSWANCILTESFAMSSTIFLFYNIISFHKKASISNVIWISFWVLFQIMLRPACLFFIPAVAIVWIIYLKEHFKYAIYGILGIIIVGFIEIGYCAKFKDNYGFFAPSFVSTYNNCWIAFPNGLMDSSYTDNPQYKEFINTYNGKKVWAPNVVDKYGLLTVQKSISESQQDKPIQWSIQACRRLMQASITPLFASNTGSIILRDLLGLNINILYILLTGYAITLIYRRHKTKSFSKISLLIWITVMGNLSMVIIGAQNSWGRLLAPSLPLIFIMFGQALNYIKVDINSYKQNIH